MTYQQITMQTTNNNTSYHQIITQATTLAPHHQPTQFGDSFYQQKNWNFLNIFYYKINYFC
jgi:hypothetical protein